MPVIGLVALGAAIVVGIMFTFFFYNRLIRAADKIIELSEDIKQIKEELRRISSHKSHERGQE